MQAFIDTLCDAFEQAHKGDPSKLLESPKLQRQRLQLALQQSCKHFQSQWRSGEAAFCEHLDEALYERIFPPLIERLIDGDTIDLESIDADLLADICSDSDFGQMLAVAHRRLLAGDYDTATAMYAVLISLDATDCRPYIGLATVLWKTQGVLAAAQLYEVLTQVWHDPELGYFGAECMRVAQWHDKAIILIERSIRSLDTMPGSWDAPTHTLREGMVQLHERLCAEK